MSENSRDKGAATCWKWKRVKGSQDLQSWKMENVNWERERKWKSKIVPCDKKMLLFYNIYKYIYMDIAPMTVYITS